MATRANPYYSDPNLAKAFNNLAGMFAPPGGTDLAGYATAAAKRAETERLKWLFDNASDPMAAQRAAVLGIQSYGNTKPGFDQTDATNRRGQDVTAATARANNAADNNRAMAQTRYGALSEGQVLPAMPGSVASQFGLPAVTEPQTGIVKLSQNQIAANVPGVGTLQGINRPQTMDEWQAQQAERLRGAGVMSDQQIADMAFGKQSGAPVQAIDPTTNKPVFMAPGQAVRMGAAPMQDQTKFTNATGLLSDGKTQVPARQAPDGGWVHAQTGERLPTDTRILDMAKPQGTNEQLGITQSNVTEANRLSASLDAAEHTVRQMRDILAQNPNVAGVPGRVKGLVQSLSSSANQVAKAYAKDAPDAALSLEEAKRMLDGVAGNYDPNIVRLQSGIMDLAYARAQIGNPSGEVSRQAFERALESFGQSYLSSQQDLETGLAAFEKDALGAGRVKVNSLRGKPLPPAAPAPAAAAPAAAAPAQPAPVERWTRGPDGRLMKVTE